MPSDVPRPAPLWPPPRTATSTPSRPRTIDIAAMTSAVSTQRAITCGREVMDPLWTGATSSYAGSPGTRTGPRNAARSSSIIAAEICALDMRIPLPPAHRPSGGRYVAGGVT